MKNLVFFFALLCSTSLVAQFSFNENGTGIQSSNSIASGDYSISLGVQTEAIGDIATAMGAITTASGTNSTAMGYDTNASADYSTTMGYQTEASGDYSTAMGVTTKAIGNISTAMGQDTKAIGSASTAMGYNTTASGLSSTALCNSTISSGNNSVAMGYFTESSGNDSTATGLETLASGASSMSMGIGTVAAGDASVSMGYHTNTNDVGTLALGIYNIIDTTPNPNTFTLQNTALIIGNGTDDGNRSNAFEVLFDGTTTIAGDLNINSDARLKANIISLGATLSKLLQIDGKTYTMKKDANHKKKIGLLAQDIEKVFPELVTETNDIKSVNYQGLVPVLINAMKEQQDEIINQKDEIDSYKTELSNQRKEIDELKTIVKQLISK